MTGPLFAFDLEARAAGLLRTGTVVASTGAQAIASFRLTLAAEWPADAAAGAAVNVIQSVPVTEGHA